MVKITGGRKTGIKTTKASQPANTTRRCNEFGTKNCILAVKS